MQTIHLNIYGNGVADTLSLLLDALQDEVEAQAPDHWDAPTRKQLAKVFAVLEMAVEFANVHEL